MEAKRLVSIILRRGWLIALCVCAGLGASLVYMHLRPPSYKVNAYVQIGIPLTATGIADVSVSSKGAISTVAQQATSDAVLQKVAQDVHGVNIAQLRTMVKASAVSNSQLLQIEVVGSTPSIAASVANADVAEVIAQVNYLAQSANDLHEQPLISQLAAEQQQISVINGQIAALQKAKAAPDDPRVVSATMRLTTALQSYQTTSKTLAQLRVDEAKRTLYLSTTQLADPTAATVSPNPSSLLLAGMAGGLLFGLGVVIVLGPPNRRVRKSVDANRTLGTDTVFAFRADDQLHGYITASSDTASSDFHSLWVSLALSEPNGLARVLMVTGVQANAGASPVTMSLARQWVADGRRVLILDAHPAHPTVSARIGAQAENAPKWALSYATPDPLPVGKYIVSGDAPNLWVIPADPEAAIQNAAAINQALGVFLEQLRQQNLDVVVIDAPPVTSQSQVRFLAERADGIVVVARKAQARERQFERLREQLKPTLTPILALFINEDAPRKNDDGWATNPDLAIGLEPGRKKSNT